MAITETHGQRGFHTDPYPECTAPLHGYRRNVGNTGWDQVEMMSAAEIAALVAASVNDKDWKDDALVATQGVPIPDLSDVDLNAIFGSVLTAGDRVLVKDGASPDGIIAVGDEYNFLYEVGTVGAPLAAGHAPLTRTTDANVDAEVTSDSAVRVSSADPTPGNRTAWFISTVDPIVLDTTPLTLTKWDAAIEASLLAAIAAATAAAVEGVKSSLDLSTVGTGVLPITVRSQITGTTARSVSLHADGGAGSLPAVVDNGTDCEIHYEDGGALSTPANVCRAIMASGLIELATPSNDSVTVLVLADAFAPEPLAGGVAAFTGTFTGAQKTQLAGLAASRSRGFLISAPAAKSANSVHADYAGNNAQDNFPGPFAGPAVPRNARVVFAAGWLTGFDITIYGVDQFGNAQSEVFIAPGADAGGTVVGTAIWGVNGIFAAAKSGNGGAFNASIGTGDKLGVTSPIALMDDFGCLFVDDVMEAVTVTNSSSGFTPATSLPDGARDYKIIVNVQD